MVEDLSNIPIPETSLHFPWLSAISYSTQGTETMLSNLDSDKASGPDRVHLFILKHGANEIAPMYTYGYIHSL